MASSRQPVGNLLPIPIRGIWNRGHRLKYLHCTIQIHVRCLEIVNRKFEVTFKFLKETGSYTGFANEMGGGSSVWSKKSSVEGEINNLCDNRVEPRNSLTACVNCL